MGNLDELLPKAMLDAIQIGLVMIGILVVISVVNPLLLVPLAVAIIFFYFILILYLRAAQDLKRLDGICKFSLNKSICIIKKNKLKMCFPQSRS